MNETNCTDPFLPIILRITNFFPLITNPQENGIYFFTDIFLDDDIKDHHFAKNHSKQPYQDK
jgi:hypothetical protein